MDQPCPICYGNDSEAIVHLNCGNFDGSKLYPKVIISWCRFCGHVFNQITNVEYENIAKYYNEEYSLVNLQSKDSQGDRPGSCNYHSLERFKHLYSLSSSVMTKNFRILDIGCAAGGFLNFLFNKGFSSLSGIDVAPNFIDEAKKHSRHIFKVSSAENIPFENSAFDIVYADQVLEHLHMPALAFKEAYRVLNSGGYFCVGVPDAMRYRQNNIFDYYWFIMREHVQHFDLHHLQLLAAREGFELVEHSTSSTPMMSEAMLLPNLNILFRKVEKNKCSHVTISGAGTMHLIDEMRSYISSQQERLKDKIYLLNNLIGRGQIYFWGIGREFLFLYENSNLKKYKGVNLVDINEYKREHQKVDGIAIVSPERLEGAVEEDVLVITAVAHSDKVALAARGLGFNGKLIKFN